MSIASTPELYTGPNEIRPCIVCNGCGHSSETTTLIEKLGPENEHNVLRPTCHSVSKRNQPGDKASSIGIGMNETRLHTSYTTESQGNRA